MSEFAKEQLLKYGWTEGKGLGKNENGIATAIRPKLKFDLRGIGHRESNFDWWETIYNKAQNNVVVEKKSDQIVLNVSNENAFNISSSKSGMKVSKQNKNYEYGTFLKTSTLHDGKLVEDNLCNVVEKNTVNDPPIRQMTDEELFKACGGRTAHKGARHGLTLSGKLARVAEQEKKLSKTLFLSNKSNDKPGYKNETKNSKSVVVSEEKEESSSQELEHEKYKLSKKSRQKIKRKINNLTDQMTKFTIVQETSSENKKHETEKNKKKSKRKRLEILESIEDDKKLKKIKIDPLVRDLFFTAEEQKIQTENDNTETTKKKSKKKGKKSKNYDSSSEKSYSSSYAEKLNTRISIKKERKLKRKQQRKVEELSSTLLAISLSSDSTINDVSEKIKSSKKSKKKKKVKT